MKSTDYRWVLGVALAVALIRVDAAEPIGVALNIPMSGPFANVGELYVKSSQFAIDAINARGGVLNGRRIEIVAFDNKNSPQEALLVLKQITDQQRAALRTEVPRRARCCCRLRQAWYDVGRGVTRVLAF